MLFRTGPLFDVLRNATEDIIILQGGTDSGKTFAAIQYFFTIAVTTKAPKEDPVITVVSESVPNLKKGAWRIATLILGGNDLLQQYVVGKPNESDHIIKFHTGWIMEFIGATDEQNAKQGKRQYLFVNEAQGILNYMVFWQMAKRTRIKTIIDYNPTAPFWAHEKLIGTNSATNDLSATVKLIISDHRHNPFLSKKEHDKTENIKDPDLWAVYARGRTGNLTGLVYTNWKQIPDADFPWLADNRFGGLDFGYTNDPTAGVRMSKQGDKIFVHELCYRADLIPTDIYRLYTAKVETFKAPGLNDEDFVFCEHDGNWIRQLRMLGLMAVAANKGPGSIKAGISKVKEYQVLYTASSLNIREELSKYMWMIDPDTGKATNTPMDVSNHLMDAIRYGIYSNFYHAA